MWQASRDDGLCPTYTAHDAGASHYGQVPQIGLTISLPMAQLLQLRGQPTASRSQFRLLQVL